MLIERMRPTAAGFIDKLSYNDVFGTSSSSRNRSSTNASTSGSSTAVQEKFDAFLPEVCRVFGFDNVDQFKINEDASTLNKAEANAIINARRFANLNLKYKGDEMLRPIASYEVAFIVSVILLNSCYLLVTDCILFRCGF